MPNHLLLDPAIRDWVVVPMLLMLIFVGLGRQYVQELLKSTPKITKKGVEELKYKNVCMQASRTRMNANFINEKSFQMRKMYLIQKKTGILRAKVPGASNPMMNNPGAMMDMMKGNLTFMLPNIAMMTFVGWFFNGFVCLKVPFPLPSNRFKLMMQRGVDLTTLDVSYVSSISWYFLLTFGLNGVYKLMLGPGSDFDDSKMMQMQMGMGGMGGMGGPAGFDASAAYRFEKEMLEIQTKHQFEGDRAERLLLGENYPLSSSSDSPVVDLSKFK